MTDTLGLVKRIKETRSKHIIGYVTMEYLNKPPIITVYK